MGAIAKSTLKERTIRLPEDDDTLLVALARKKRIPPAVLMRMWVSQALEAAVSGTEDMGQRQVIGRS